MTEHYGLHEHVWQRAWYCDRWKFVLQGDGFEELYDLADAPLSATIWRAMGTTVSAAR